MGKFNLLHGSIVYYIKEQIVTEKMFIVVLWRLWVEIETHKWRDLELNLSKTVEELRQDSQLIQANRKKKLRENEKLLECSFAQI